MYISWRPTAPRETNYELLWLGVSLTGLFAAAAWFVLGLPWPVCVFHALTGLPCVTCGATRSTIEFLQGHFLSALAFNPLVFIGLLLIALFDVYAFIVLIAGAPRLRAAAFSPLEKNIVRISVVALLALNWIYLLAHPPA